jgi:hypothetical protein
MWSHGMTTQESKIDEWQTSFRSNPILDGSTNDILKVEGVNVASVKDVSSEVPRDFRFEERISDLPQNWPKKISHCVSSVKMWL